MEYTVTFLKWDTGRIFNTDNFKCSISFSVVESSKSGTPRGKESSHHLDLEMSDTLMDYWRIPDALSDRISNDMIKLGLQAAEDYITGELRRGPLQRYLSICMTTDNSPTSCPYQVDNIAYPDETSFSVATDGPDDSGYPSNVHPNVRILTNRMEDSLKRNDTSGVLHASASIFETMAKDTVGLPTIQDQTLKGFFDRYRRDSRLSKELLDYILSIYDRRNTAPLAGHGSTKSPSLSREEAVTLCEITKALVSSEYTLNKKT